MHHEVVKPFLNGGLYDNIFGHFFLPLIQSEIAISLSQSVLNYIIRVCFEM